MYVNRGGPSNTSRHPDVESTRGLNFLSCGYCIARNHDDKIRRGGGSAVFCSSRGKQEIILHHEESAQIITLFFSREEGNVVYGAGMKAGERAVWRYLHEGGHCDPLCTESWVKHLVEDLCLEHKPETWGIFLYPIEYNVHQWIQA